MLQSEHDIDIILLQGLDHLQKANGRGCNYYIKIQSWLLMLKVAA